MSQILGVVSQYIVIGAVLIGLFLILRNPAGLSKIIDSISSLNVGAIGAFKK